MTETPWKFKDAVKQRKNEEGHAHQEDMFSLFEKGEDVEGGVQIKLDGRYQETGNYFLESDIWKRPEKCLCIGGKNPGFEHPVNIIFYYESIREFLRTYPNTPLVGTCENNVKGYIPSVEKILRFMKVIK